MPEMEVIKRVEISTIVQDFGPVPSSRSQNEQPTMLACPPNDVLNLKELSANRIVSVRLIKIIF